jgi:hypothetical protein
VKIQKTGKCFAHTKAAVSCCIGFGALAWCGSGVELLLSCVALALASDCGVWLWCLPVASGCVFGLCLFNCPQKN